MRSITLLALVIAASPLLAQTAEPEAPTRVVNAVVFFDKGQDPAAIQKTLTDLVQRAATRMQADNEALDAPLVETTHREGEGRGRVDFVELRVTMPAGMSQAGLLQAVGADQACGGKEASCGDSCPKLDELGTSGHWHLLPGETHGCLVTFFADNASMDEAKRLVLRHPRRYGLEPQTDADKARVTVGRPPWPPEIDKQP